jgi:aminoglycoside phosphotransferase (APT) family kinase protein
MAEPALDALLARAQDAARRRWPHARITAVERLPGGISSLTFSARLSAPGDSDGRSGRIVIKMAPPGLEPVRNRDVLRQARVMRALRHARGVPVPAVLLEDDGSPPLFMMEFVDGDSYEPKWDHRGSPPTPEVVDARARAAAQMLARLQALTPGQVGLSGEPALSPAQELERWRRLFATAGGDLRGDEESLARALSARIPPPAAPRILHGDYRLGNVQFQGDRPAAVIDWEIWSVGDPRTDLAWLLTFADPVAQRVSHRDAANQAAADAMPGRDHLLGEYLSIGGRDPPRDLGWFEALCCYKLGATMAVLAKRNRRLAEPDPGLELVAATTPPMIARGLKLLRSAPPAR